MGSFLEANRDYPDELHDFHNGYPLADEKVKIIKEILSEHQWQITEDNFFFLSKNEKHIPKLGNKRKCKLHY